MLISNYYCFHYYKFEDSQLTLSNILSDAPSSAPQEMAIRHLPSPRGAEVVRLAFGGFADCVQAVAEDAVNVPPIVPQPRMVN